VHHPTEQAPPVHDTNDSSTANRLARWRSRPAARTGRATDAVGWDGSLLRNKKLSPTPPFPGRPDRTGHPDQRA
jgi:hypothetical protein